ncbi:uncharacterized protein LOC122507501 [Leptopilina heterotoma]|uniref:uncharacterized protein LOC122507501 n=1 Tax=Leptopilina heterotoma TaxID=63436 RepID=UPI001CA96078|nr:uncharacterized protein LOC122507501 [Leptopilina heterotoma]
MEETEFLEEKLIIGGDFNIRIGQLGRFAGINADGEDEERNSRDNVINNGGKNLVNLVEQKGWIILNGVAVGDEMGEFTFTGTRGNSCWEDITSFKIEDRVESDHMPMCLKLFSGGKKKMEAIGDKCIENKTVYSWSEEDIPIFNTRTQRLESQIKPDDNVEDLWKDLKTNVEIAVIKKEIKIRKWKIGKIDKSAYLEKRREWRTICKQKEKDHKEKEENDLKNIKDEKEVWKYLNKGRKKKSIEDNNIKDEEWIEHFKNLLEGSEVRITGTAGDLNREEKEEEKLRKEEITKAMKNMKKGKAAGIDNIPYEVWMYGGVDLIDRFYTVIKKVWDGAGFPEDWKMAIITPIYKKEDPNDVKNYRGLSLLVTAYKIYTKVIKERLEKEVEGKNILPEGQAGFRKKRSTIDNIFVLNHVTQKARGKKDKVYGMFIDLKKAYDTVDREKLWNIMKKVGISEYLIEKVKEIYYETKVRIKKKDGLTDEFWTSKGVRQGCVLSPILFCIYLTELEEEFKVRNIGGVKIGSLRIWTLAFADDIVLLAYGRDALLDMMDTLKRFLKERQLILSVEKTKILVFNKGKRGKKEVWKWEGEEIEEVKTFKYLGFTFNDECNYKDHIKELKRKGVVAAKITWGLGENRCRGDFIRRKMLFTYLVKSVMSYGVEIWGWEEKKELEKIQMDYFRWILRLDICTPKYIVYKETETYKMKIDWSKRATKYEEKITKQDGRLTKLCWMEKIKLGEEDKYGEERKKFYNGLGLSTLDVEMKKDMGKNVHVEVWERGRDIEKQMVIGMINESSFNPRYKHIMAEGLPKYLRNYNRGRELDVIAKIRCGNVERINRYWLNEEDWICNLCKEGWGTFEHLLLECEVTKQWTEGFLEGVNDKIKVLTNEDGRIEVSRVFKHIVKQIKVKE